MAPKTAYEDDYKAVFTSFGNLVDIYVIRDRNGFSKGCAFVKYDSVKSARDAIDALHDKYVMAGGFRTLVVTIADDRRTPQPAGHVLDTGGLLDGYRVIPRISGMSKGEHGNHNAVDWPGYTTPGVPIAPAQASYAITQPVAPSSLMPGVRYVYYGGTPPQGTYVYYPYVSMPCAQTSVAAPMSGNTHQALTLCPTPGSTVVPGDVWVDSPGAGLEMSQTRDGSRSQHVHGGEFSWEMKATSPEEEGKRWAKQTVGPMGANLFVYYLPGSLSDADLATAFAPFGRVVSAKVYYDRDTGESKGFGTYWQHTSTAVVTKCPFLHFHRGNILATKAGLA